MECPHCGATSESPEPKCSYCGKMKVSAEVIRETAISFAKSCEEQLEKAVVKGHGWSVVPWLFSLLGSVGVWFGLRHIGVGVIATILCTLCYLFVGLITMAAHLSYNEKRSMDRLWQSKLRGELEQFLAPLSMKHQSFELIVFEELPEHSYLRQTLQRGAKESPTLARHLEAAAAAIEARETADKRSQEVS